MVDTLTLNYIVNEYGEDIFDFNYVFPDITIDNVLINKQTLQDQFIDYFLYYQIGYSTIDEFKWRLKRKWHENIRQLTKQLELENKITYDLNDETEKLTRNKTTDEAGEINITRGRTGNTDVNGTQTNDNRFSDTPNQNMGTIENPNFLTERTLDDLTTTNTTDFSENETNKNQNMKNVGEEETITKTLSKNNIMKFYNLSDKFHNIIFEFYKKFESLFITDCLIYGGILYV
mgnify:CR=1 FL=1